MDGSLDPNLEPTPISRVRCKISPTLRPSGQICMTVLAEPQAHVEVVISSAFGGARPPNLSQAPTPPMVLIYSVPIAASDSSVLFPFQRPGNKQPCRVIGPRWASDRKMSETVTQKGKFWMTRLHQTSALQSVGLCKPASAHFSGCRCRLRCLGRACLPTMEGWRSGASSSGVAGVTLTCRSDLDSWISIDGCDAIRCCR